MGKGGKAGPAGIGVHIFDEHRLPGLGGVQARPLGDVILICVHRRCGFARRRPRHDLAFVFQGHSRFLTSRNHSYREGPDITENRFEGGLLVKEFVQLGGNAVNRLVVMHLEASLRALAAASMTRTEI